MIYLFLAIFIFLFPSPVSAYFDSHLNSGSLISLSADWTPPPTPSLIYPPNDTQVFVDDFYQFWNTVVDDYSNPVIYEYQTCSDLTCADVLTTEHLNTTTRSGGETGNVFWRVSALDAFGNQSPWSDIFKVFVYENEPQISLVVSNDTFQKEISQKTAGFDLTYETASGWPLADSDFSLFLNQQPVFQLTPKNLDSDSSFDHQTKTLNTQLFFDLSQSSPPFNWTTDVGSQSQVDLQPLNDVVYVPVDTLFTFNYSDPEISQIKYRFDSDFFQVGDHFTLSLVGEYSLEFYAVSIHGFDYPMRQVKIIVDGTTPEPIDTLLAVPTLSGVNLSWLSPGGNLYDLRYQDNCSQATDLDWDTATRFFLNPPQVVGETEFVFLPLSSGSYCFALKAADAAPNWTPHSLPATCIIN